MQSLPFIVMLAALVAVACGATETLAPASRLTAFTNARIIVGNEGAVIENGTLVMRDGQIEAVGATVSTSVPADAEVRNVQGKTIIPGLINVHGHVNRTRWF